MLRHRPNEKYNIKKVLKYYLIIHLTTCTCNLGIVIIVEKRSKKSYQICIRTYHPEKSLL